MTESGHAITIRSDGPEGYKTEILIDGNPVNWVTECVVRIAADDVHRVTLTLIPQRVEITLPDGQLEVISPVYRDEAVMGSRWARDFAGGTPPPDQRPPEPGRDPDTQHRGNPFRAGGIVDE